MPFRFGILDLTAALIVLIAIIIPPPGVTVTPAYEASDDTLRAIAMYQARLAARPGDAEAAEALSKLLVEARQSDWAVQVAGEATKHGGEDAWRALLAVSVAHAERIEVYKAHEYAQKALEACRTLGPERCPPHEQARLAVYHDQLEAGVRSGIDPRVDPEGYQNAVLRTVRMIRVRGGTPNVDEDEDQEQEQKNDSDGQGAGNQGDPGKPSAPPSPAGAGPSPAPGN